MAGFGTIDIDATGSAVGGGNPDGTSYQLSTTNGYYLLGFDAPEPEQEIQWASSADTEGARQANQRYQNRVVTVRYRLAKATDAALEAELNSLGRKVGKLVREGGTLKVPFPSGTVGYFDVLNASHGFPFEQRFQRIQRAEVVLTLPCLPGIRTAEVELGSDTVETTLPYLVKTVTGPAGDMPALGRLLIDEDQGASQWWLTWGIQSRYCSNSANADLFYQAEGRTALGGAATAVGATGASGAGSNVMRQGTLTATLQAMLSTQATGGGAHLSHIGTFRIYARVQVPTSNTGTVTLAFEWGEGDYLRSVQNASVTIAPSQEGQWLLVDLGLVTLSKVTAGTQRWEGRILASSTVVGDDLDVDYLLLIPVDEGSGIVVGVDRSFTPTSLSARDEFTSTTSGNNLNGRAAPVGGSWATSGAATDIIFQDAVSPFDEHIARAATGTRYAVLGTTDYTNIEISVSVSLDAAFSGNIAHAIARWTDSSNHLALRWEPAATGPNGSLKLVSVIAAAESVLDSAETGLSMSGRITLRLSSSGQVTGALESMTGTTIATVTASNTVLATGGTLATGKPVLAITGDASFPQFIRMDTVTVAVPPQDAAVFASQSIEIRHDRVVREDSGGTLWVTPSSYTGDYLLIPPTGAEARSTRVIVKGTRMNPNEGDPAIDDISARLFATPRFLAIPD